jgi:NAD(P)-dependent dehydrogenase (short-subunit alcohol dehydrogenase family)
LRTAPQFLAALPNQGHFPEKDMIMSKLKGKVAVVTGASKGIGAGIAKALAAEGASVVVNYASSKAGADAVVAAITKAGGKAVAVGGDVSKAADAQGIIDGALKHFGRLDILVNNSGRRLPVRPPRSDHWRSLPGTWAQENSRQFDQPRDG